VIRVPIWAREESIAFLTRRTGREDDQADTLAEELGDLPLALAQAAAFIAATGTSYSQYIALFRTRRTELWSSESRFLSSNRKTVDTTWLISIQRVSADSSEAIELLWFLAAIGSGSLERWRSEPTLLNRNLFRILSDSLRLSSAMGVLRQYSLVE